MSGITCVQEDNITISSMTAGGVDLLTTSGGYKVQQMGDATIVVDAPFSDYPNTINVQIVYNENNETLHEFYRAEFENRIVWQSSQDFTGPADAYTFEWEGRDNKYGRILLDGDYTVVAK
ncbi:MAG: hypothetical protein ACLFSB_12000, partial [Chitinispirillaceae bacterium]